MNIVADENIPEVEQAFAELGKVILRPGREIERRDLQNCQCLVVRTVTTVDQALLQDTPVEFVGTATIGTDHVDLEYLDRNQIGFSNAPGCNAEAASEYVISGLFALSEHRNFNPFNLKAGIVGFGNVGSRVYHKLQALGIDTLVNDPPLATQGSSSQDYVDLETIIRECDLITLHVPLTRQGNHPTYHLLDGSRLENLRQNCVLINAARGSVVDNRALLDELQRRDDLIVFLDTWENEPNILPELLDRVALATPHIAGYSVEGRLRGTQMVLDAACDFFGTSTRWQMSQYLPDTMKIEPPDSGSDLAFWQQLFRKHHNIWQDHLALTDASINRDENFAAHFERLRKVYEHRFEYERYRLSATRTKKAAAIAHKLRFKGP